MERGLVPLHVLIVLADHAQGVVVAAGIHAFRAALALGGVNEYSKFAAADAFLLEDGVVLGGLYPLRAQARAQLLVGELGQPIGESGGISHFRQDRRIRTLRDAIHAAHAVFDNKERNVGSDIAEVAERPGGRRNNAAGYSVVGF